MSNHPYQKITNDRHFIINCYVEMLSRINEIEIIQLIESNPEDFSIIENAISNSRAVNIDEIVKDIQHASPVDIVETVATGQMVIDIRHPDDEELNPLKESFLIIKIPFYKLMPKFLAKYI